jgi:hypothetical protein
MNAFAVATAIMLLGEGASDCSFDWLPTDGLPGLSNTALTTVVWDPDGPGPEPELLVVGGGFSIAGDKRANNIAAWDGANWRTFGTGIAGTVGALTVYNGELVAAGARTYVDGTLTAFIERWDGSSWRFVGTGLSGGVNSPTVYAMTTFGGDLIAAGSFTSADGSGANSIARCDGTTWRSLGSGITRSNSYAHVDSLVVYKGDLIAGGYFDTADGSPAKGIARWDGSKWWDMAGGVEDPPSTPQVNALIVADGDLIAGGAFARAGGIGARSIARWDGERWYEFAPGTGAYSWIDALARFDGFIVAAGPIHNGPVARWDGQAWQPLGDGIPRLSDPLGGCDFPVAIDTSVHTLAVYHNELVAAGGFKFASEKSARHIARWNGVEWNTLGSGMSTLPGALIVHEGRLIAGGGFQAAAEHARSLVTAWGGQSWERLGDGVEGVIHTLASYRGDIIVGGQISLADDPASRLVGRWDGSQWRPLGTGIGQPYACEWVDGLIELNGDLIVGGSFRGAGDTDARNIARWDGQTWHTLGGGINGAFGAMTVYDQRLIVGGGFNAAGGKNARNIAAWDGSNWEPLGSGLDGSVQALTVFGGELIAFFSLSGEFPATHVARWDGSSWTPMGLGMDNYVAALAVYNGELFATGDFTSAGGTPVDSIARWDGAGWHPIPSGMIYWAWDLTVYHGELIVAGSAALSDGRASANWSRWGPTTARADFDADGDVDLLDFMHLPVCVTGPTPPSGSAIAPGECLCTFNSEGDGDIDLADVAAVQNAFTSSQHK